MFIHWRQFNNPKGETMKIKWATALEGFIADHGVNYTVNPGLNPHTITIHSAWVHCETGKTGFDHDTVSTISEARLVLGY